MLQVRLLALALERPVEHNRGVSDMVVQAIQLHDVVGPVADAQQEKLVKEKFEGAESLNSVQDIQKSKIFELIDRIKKIKK